MFILGFATVLVIVCALIVKSWRNAPKGNVPPEYPGALPLIGHGHLFGSCSRSSVAFWKLLKDIATFASSCRGIASFKIGFKQLYMIADPDDCVTVANFCLEKDIVYDFLKPIIGNSLITGDALWNLLKDIATFASSYGGIASFKIGFKQLYMITDPDDCVTVANLCLEKDIVYDFMKPTIGEGLLTGAVPTWKIHRKLLTPAFSQGVLDGFLGVFNSQAERLVFALGQESGKGPFNSWSVVGPNALETIYLTAMGGAKADESLSDRYMHAAEELYNIIIQRFQKFWLHPELTFNMSSLGKKMNAYTKIVHDVSNSVLQAKKRELRTENSDVQKLDTKYKSFIDLIIELSGDKALLTDQEIREEVDTIIVAGHDTSASTLVYTLIALGSHPEVQERLFKEVEEVLDDREVKKQDLNKLVYLEAVLKETLRLYPIAPFVVRRLTENVQLKNHSLPAGSGVFLGFYALHRSKLWGADADQFDPTRWLDKSRLPDHQAAFSAFSLGRRMCIGKNYALMSMKTTLAHLVRNFRFKSDISKLQLKLDIMLKPHDGHYISLEKRT